MHFFCNSEISFHYVSFGQSLWTECVLKSLLTRPVTLARMFVPYLLLLVLTFS